MEETKPTDSESPLIAALHLHIQQVAQRSLDARMLVELEKTCLLARQMLAVGKAPDAMAKGGLVGVWPPGNIGNIGYDTPMSEYAMPAVSSYGETYGATVLREIMPILQSLMPKSAPAAPEPRISYKDLAEAIACAHAASDALLESELRRLLSSEIDSYLSETKPSPVLVEVLSESEVAA